MDIPSEEKLNEITRKLAAILRIQDWDIEVKAANAIEMNEVTNFDDQGCVAVDFVHKMADIKIGKDSVENWYKTLIHELLHVQDAEYHQYLKSKFDIDNDPCCINIEEQRINQLAKIMCALYPVENVLKEEPSK